MLPRIPKRVLVTGSTGLLGSPLVQELRSQGHLVLSHGSGLHGGDVVFDLCDRQSTFFHLKSARPQVIINLVALTNVDLCETQRQKAYRLNVLTTSNLADWVECESKPVLLIHISTDQLYEGPGLKTESEVTLINTYAWSKFTSEQIVARVGGISLRTNFFGPSQVSHRVSFSDWLYASYLNRKPLSLFSDVYFSPLSLATLSQAIGRVVDRPIPGTYNLGSHRGMSKADFGLYLGKLFGFDSENVSITSCEKSSLVAPRPKDMRMDSSLFEETFEFLLPTLSEEIDSLRGGYEISNGFSDRTKENWA